MIKKSILRASLLLATLGLVTPAYSEQSQETQIQVQEQKYSLEQIISENPPKDLTREDCLEALKITLGKRYIELSKDSFRKQLWNNFRKNCPTNFLKYLTILYSQESDTEYKTKITKNEMIFYSVVFPWMSPNNLSDTDQRLINQIKEDMDTASKVPQSIFSYFLFKK